MLSILRSKYRVPLSHLQNVAAELSQYSDSPWSDIKLYVLNREVHFNEPETGKGRGVVSKQYALLPLDDVEDDMRAIVESMRRRGPEMYGRVERRRNVVRNAPVIVGTRIPVAAIKRYANAGYAVDAILREYPTLTPEDVEAALRYEGRDVA